MRTILALLLLCGPVLGQGTGLLADPWTNLAYPLSGPWMIKAGNKVWLRGGKYTGIFTATLNGTLASSTMVRCYPGELCIIEGGTTQNWIITSSPAYLTWRDIAYQSSAGTTRMSAEDGSDPTDIVRAYPPAVGVYQNCVIRNFGESNNGQGQTGCLIYYNGWDAPDRCHGHGTYIQNTVGGSRIYSIDNVVMNNGMNGMRSYSETAGKTDNISFVGCTSFGNGTIGLTHHTAERDLLLGNTEARPNDIEFTYNAVGLGGSVQFDYPGTAGSGPDGLVLTGNLFGVHVDTGYSINVEATDNKINGTFTCSGCTVNTGNETGTPTENWVSFRPNTLRDTFTITGVAGTFRDHRIGIMRIFNWENAATVTFDLAPYRTTGGTGLLTDAETVYARDCQNYMKTAAQIDAGLAGDPHYLRTRANGLGPIVATSSGNNLVLPMTLTDVEPMDGLTGTFTQPTHTARAGLQCFVLESN